MIAARIDHLSPEGRDLIRKASVFARSSFTLAELDLIAVPTGEALGRLEEEELLEHDGDRPDVWRFSHGMVRDVAYESLPKRERQRLHLLVADGLSATRRRPPAARARSRSTWSRRRSPRSTSTRATERSPNGRSRPWLTPATSPARG